LPFVLGHEGVGIVEEGPLKSKMVVPEPTVSCGYCVQCKKGNSNLCLNQRFLSLPPDPGILRETLWHPDELLIPLPDGMPPKVAVMMEPMSIAVHTFDLLKLRAGSSLAILGSGPIGLCCLILGKAIGATPIACTDVLPHRCKAAKDLGADVVLNPSTDDVKSLGVFDYVIEASGDEGAHRDMLTVSDLGAKVAIVGTPWRGEIKLVGHEPRRKGLSFYMVRRSRNTMERAVRLAQDGHLPLDRVVSHVLPLDDAQIAFDIASEYKNGCLKMVISL
jgi:L-iditol 2-dehydrogenase